MRKKYDALFDRLNNLPESSQVFILADIFGSLTALTEEKWARDVLEEIEKTVTSFETKIKNARGSGR
jgi:hypothetical protein